MKKSISAFDRCKLCLDNKKTNNFLFYSKLLKEKTFFCLGHETSFHMKRQNIETICFNQNLNIFVRNTYMTESTWPNEYDWNLANMTEVYIWSCSINNVYHCQFYSHVWMLTFVDVKQFCSCSNQNLVIFIWSCKLASCLFVLILIV